MRSSLALLAALGAALALAGVGAGAGNDRPEPGLDPNVALEIRAVRPAQELPVALRDLAAETGSPAVARAIRAGLAAPSHAGLRLQRLLAPFSTVVLSVERSCPPPALLACRSAVRFAGRLRPGAPGQGGRDIDAVLLAELDTAGFQGLQAQQAPGGARLGGRITARGETLARWRLEEGVLEVVTGGLGLAPGAIDPPHDAANSSAAVQFDVNAELLASLAGG